MRTAKRATEVHEARSAVDIMSLLHQPDDGINDPAASSGGKIFNVPLRNFDGHLRLPEKFYMDMVDKDQPQQIWISAVGSPKYTTTDLHHDDGHGYSTMKRGAKLWAIWPPTQQNRKIMEEGYKTGNIGIAWAKRKLKNGILLTQRAGDTISLPSFCPHAVLTLETGIMWGAEIFLISKTPARIRWTKAIALHSKYSSIKAAGDQDYVTKRFIDQLQSALNEGTQDGFLTDIVQTWRESRQDLVEFWELIPGKKQDEIKQIVIQMVEEMWRAQGTDTMCNCSECYQQKKLSSRNSKVTPSTVYWQVHLQPM